MAMKDVEIQGGGVFGLAIAWACARRGASIRVADIRRIGGGASGGPLGALAPHAPDNWNGKKAFQLESLLMAEDWWGEVADESDINPGYGKVGRLTCIADRAGAQELAERRAIAAAKNWRGQAQWTTESLGNAWEFGSDSGVVAHDTLSARIQPSLAIKGLAEALRRAGHAVDENAVEFGKGHLTVLAAGYEGLDQLNRELNQDLGRGEKGQALLLDYEAGGMPQIYADGIHVVPHFDGTTAIGSTSERHFSDPNSVDELLDGLHRRALRLLPAISGADVLTKWAGVRPRTATRSPLLGPHPTRDRHFIANGGFKTGFGFAPLVGEVMAELILEGRCRIPEEFLTCSRIGGNPAWES